MLSLIVMQMDFDVLMVTEPGEDHRRRKGGGKPSCPPTASCLYCFLICRFRAFLPGS